MNTSRKIYIKDIFYILIPIMLLLISLLMQITHSSEGFIAETKNIIWFGSIIALFITLMIFTFKEWSVMLNIIAYNISSVIMLEEIPDIIYFTPSISAICFLVSILGSNGDKENSSDS